MGAVQSALSVGGCGREIFVLATCSMQFAKAGSAATLAQQEKKNSADVQRGGFIPRGGKKKQMNNPFYYSLTRRSRAQVLLTRARNIDT